MLKVLKKSKKSLKEAWKITLRSFLILYSKSVASITYGKQSLETKKSEQKSWGFPPY